MSKRGKVSLAFSVKIYYTMGATCRCDGMVDVVDSKSTVAGLSAACGGYSEGAAGAAVGEGRSRWSARTFAGHRKRWRHQAAEGSHHKKVASGIKNFNNNTPAGVMEW